MKLENFITVQIRWNLTSIGKIEFKENFVHDIYVKKLMLRI